MRQCCPFNIGWRIRRSKAEELILPPRSKELRTPQRSEEFESIAEERSVTAGRRAGLTRPGAGTTRRKTSAGVEATPRRARDSS